MKVLSGEPLSGKPLVESLPPPNTKRWVVSRKAAVVAAVRSGAITIEEACRAYQLSEEELLSWERAFEIHGLAGLRATHIQVYRASRPARNSAPPLDGALYREIAHGLRKLARQCRSRRARSELLHLAASYDQRAECPAR
jgi:transposase-like protein